MTEATGKVSSHNPVAGSLEESDGNVVPEKSANKGCTSPAESMEGRAPTERNSEQKAALMTSLGDDETVDEIKESQPALETKSFFSGGRAGKARPLKPWEHTRHSCALEPTDAALRRRPDKTGPIPARRRGNHPIGQVAGCRLPRQGRASHFVRHSDA